MMKFWRENVYAAGVLLIFRVYLGWQWMTAGIHKLTGGFDATGYLKGAVAKPVMDKATNELVYPTFTGFLEHFALPNAKIFNIVIPIGETLVGLGLILGALTTAAAFFGLLMNFMFLFAGTISTNPWMVLIGTIVLAGGINAGKFGVDYYLLPLLRKLFHKKDNKNDGADAGKGINTPAHI
ncbi:DoxX family membrane protein [Paenibacillus spongiae]|uniref:DoxX family protein n=1 Tax=Paenibacillus spongiae TaxID=2909671 RepID=A0ABY5SFF0_9BACL|nr:DoxX family protein [Paenibacillus spongiae]UVI31398.1 DoxX family protein [Paenibacillus spongiae]